MDTVSRYRSIIESVLREYAQVPSPDESVARQTVFDRENNHYLLVNVGWDHRRRVFGTIAHIDLIADKAWVQHDGTEVGLANLLREAGIPADHIVLGYRIPEIRKHTGYAVA